MNVVGYEEVPPAALESFLSETPGALFYHSTRYRRFLVELLGCDDVSLVVSDAGRVRGFFPLLQSTREPGRVLNSLPFYGSHGDVLADGVETGQALWDAYGRLLQDPGVLAATVVSNPFRAPESWQIPAHNLRDQRIGQVLELPDSDDPQALLARIQGSARRNVRKAQRRGVVVEVDGGAEALARLRGLHEENMAAIGGRAKPAQFFDGVLQHFLPGEDYELYQARLEGEVVACLLLFFAGDTVEYFVPAIQASARSEQPLAAILFEAMRRAIRRGYTRWNWGGTWLSQGGVYQFKKKWGARDVPYDYHVQLNEPGLRQWSVASLSTTFPNFYVLPFSELEEAKPES